MSRQRLPEGEAERAGEYLPMFGRDGSQANMKTVILERKKTEKTQAASSGDRDAFSQ